MIQKNLVPDNHVMIVIDGKLRSVRKEHHKVARTVHSTGVVSGEVANAIATPFMMIGDACLALGRGARDSQFGQSAQYGWDRAERRKAVFSQKRSLRSVEIKELQGILLDRGVNAKQILDMNENQIRGMVADLSTPDSYLDQDSYVGQVLEVVQEPAAPKMASIPAPTLTPAHA